MTDLASNWCKWLFTMKFLKYKWHCGPVSQTWYKTFADSWLQWNTWSTNDTVDLFNRKLVPSNWKCDIFCTEDTRKLVTSNVIPGEHYLITFEDTQHLWHHKCRRHVWRNKKIWLQIFLGNTGYNFSREKVWL